MGTTAAAGSAKRPPFDDFVEITEADGVRVDLRYATSNNVFGRNLYGDFNRFLLHPIAATKLAHAVEGVAALRPGWRLLLLDGLRPNRIQRILWSSVRGTPQESYVGDPAIGSIHGFGFAVDLTLVDAHGLEVDMGTPFDDFSPLAEPQREADHLLDGLISYAQVENRRFLRQIMTAAGFHFIPIEWWHFDALPPSEVRGRFPLVE